MLEGKLKKEYRDALISMINQSQFKGAEAEVILDLKKQLNDFQEEEEAK